MDIEFCNDQCKVYETHLNELKSNRVTVDPKEVEKLERRYKECQDVYEQIHSQFLKSESAVQKLDEKIRAVGADKVEAQQNKINSIQKELDDAKSLMSKANVSILQYCHMLESPYIAYTNELQKNLVNTNSVSTNFWIIQTIISIILAPYIVSSIDNTSVNTKSG